MVCSFYVTYVSFLEFMKAGVRGITLIYPAGDDGPFRYGGTGGATFDPSFPATSMPFVLFCFAFLYPFFEFLSFYIFIVLKFFIGPYVTSVGGTQFYSVFDAPECYNV